VTQTAQWATPTANEDAAVVSANMQEMLAHQAKWFARGTTPSPSAGLMGKSDSCPDVQPWPTPTTETMRAQSPEAMAKETIRRGSTEGSLALTAAAMTAPTKRAGLNPRFALWLTGYPMDHLDVPYTKPGGRSRKTSSTGSPSSVPLATPSSPNARSA
jgi:hypothetical protein